MRFKCPVTNRCEWHRWFAWHPVRVGERCVWWEWVERKFDWNKGRIVILTSYDPGLPAGEWEYRECM